MEYSCFEYPLNNTIRLIFLFCYWRVRSICPLVQAGCSCWQMISQFLRGIWQLLLMSLVSALQFSGFTLPRLNPCCFFCHKLWENCSKAESCGCWILGISDWPWLWPPSKVDFAGPAFAETPCVGVLRQAKRWAVWIGSQCIPRPWLATWMPWMLLDALETGVGFGCWHLVDMKLTSKLAYIVGIKWVIIGFWWGIIPQCII